MGITEKEKHMMVLDALIDALGRSEDQSAEEIKEELREEGVDVDSSLDRLKKIQQNISMEAKRSALDTAIAEFRVILKRCLDMKSRRTVDEHSDPEDLYNSPIFDD